MKGLEPIRLRDEAQNSEFDAGLTNGVAQLARDFAVPYGRDLTMLNARTPSKTL